jgi:hypothetical protein
LARQLDAKLLIANVLEDYGNAAIGVCILVITSIVTHSYRHYAKIAFLRPERRISILIDKKQKKTIPLHSLFVPLFRGLLDAKKRFSKFWKPLDSS